MSSTFSTLKKVKEHLGDNYTSSQLLSVLDTLLFNALESIVQNTQWLDLVVGNLLMWYGDNKRRKLSPAPKETVLTLCFEFLATNDTDKKMGYLRKMEVERTIWFCACKLFIEGAGHMSFTSDALRLRYRERPDGDVFVAARDCRVWYEHSCTMKRYIMEKYTRYIITMANAYSKGAAMNVDLDDLIQNFMLSMSKAIDKCSSNCGTLTAYIGQWLRSASTQGHEYGVAYTVPPSVRKQFLNNGRPPNIYVKLEDCDETESLGPEDILEKEYETRHIRMLAKHADPHGFARMRLEIEEHLSDQELYLLECKAECLST